MRAYSNWLYRRMNGWVLAAALVVFAGFIIWVLPGESERSQAATGGGATPDSSFYYNAQDMYAMADAFGEEGRAYYIRARYTFDLLWPLAYTVFLTAALTLLYRDAQSSLWRRVNVIPTVALAMDYAENAAAALTMVRYPARTPVIADLTTVFTMSKWALIYGSFGLVAAAIMWFLVGLVPRWRRRS